MVISLARKLEDYAVVYFGAALFKILRLLSVGTFSVHMFACIFFRVKISSAVNPDDVADFYQSKNVEDEVIIYCLRSGCSTIIGDSTLCCRI
jgi:hypothetical protein